MKGFLIGLLALGSVTCFGSTAFRCQMTTGHCGEDGGRYGRWIKATSSTDAAIQCQKQADFVEQKLCGISMSGNYGEQFVIPSTSLN